MADREQVLADIAAPHHLQHVDIAHDASKPVIDREAHIGTWDKEKHLNSIQAGVPLHHVADSKDRSAPVIEPGVHVQPSQRKELLTEVRAAAAHAAVVREVNAVAGAAGAGDGDEDLEASPLVQQLRHVDTDDKARPAIDPDAHVHTWPKEQLLQEVAAPHHLRHVEQVADRSAPAIPPDAHVGVSPAKAVLEQIGSGERPALKHVEAPR